MGRSSQPRHRQVDCPCPGGVRLGAHRSRLVTPADTHGQTLVVVMESSQARRVIRDLGVPPSRVLLLGDLDPHPITARGIADPWGHGRDVFEEVYRRISRCVTALAEGLEGCRPGPVPSATLALAPVGAPGDDPRQIRLAHG